jgi:hypothetical protein
MEMEDLSLNAAQDGGALAAEACPSGAAMLEARHKMPVPQHESAGLHPGGQLADAPASSCLELFEATSNVEPLGVRPADAAGSGCTGA